MFKQKKLKSKNTKELKYISLLESKNDQNEEVIDLQNKVIRLQDELRKRDNELLIYREKEIEKYKKKLKKDKETK